MTSSNHIVRFWIIDREGDILHPPDGGHIGDLPPPLGDFFKRCREGGKNLVVCLGQREYGACPLLFPDGGEGVFLYEACLERVYKKIRKLQAQNLEMEAILESSHDGFVVADDRGILLRINDNYTKATGISREKIIGRSVYDEDMQKLFSPSGTALVLESRDTVTLTQRFAGGRQSIITSSPVRNEDGEIFRVVTNVRDMTEILKLREELDVTTSRLQESDQKLEELSKQLYICNEDAITTPTMDTLYKKAVKFAGVEAPLLITGASGVGKEVLANFVHLNSERSRAPFLKINCGAIPENLLETELFGHEEGAFTGARRRGRIGLFEAAAGGSILLDEIGELPLLLQVKLLRFVQHKEFFRVGGISPRTVDVRIIAATNKDLETMIEKGSFRVDLYYRLNILQLYIPPLAERRQDIIPLAHAFLKKFNAKHHAQKSIAPSLYNLLENHPWHGNVRELENLIERLVLVSPAREILPEHLPWTARRQEERAAAVQYPGHYRDALAQFEAGFWQAAIARYGSCRQAALHNGVDPSTVIKKAARLKLSKRNAEKEIQ